MTKMIPHVSKTNFNNTYQNQRILPKI